MNFEKTGKVAISCGVVQQCAYSYAGTLVAVPGGFNVTFDFPPFTSSLPPASFSTTRGSRIVFPYGYWNWISINKESMEALKVACEDASVWPF